MDVANFGDGVRMKKPSGVGGDGPISCYERLKLTAYVELPTWRLNFNCNRRKPIAQSLFPEFFCTDKAAI